MNGVGPCRQRGVDDGDQLLPDQHIGHIQLQGASVTERIYGDPEATAGLFTSDGWLRTGDCGLFVDGQLVITGRQKDLIIINGQNYYPHDIEEIAAGLDELDLGKVVVAGATPSGAQTEELIVFILFRQDLDAFRELADRVADRAVQIFGGRGYMRENVAERFFRELRVDRIWEGTSEIQRLIIARCLIKRGLTDM